MKKKNKMVKKKEKRITNTELLDSINRSFSRVEKKMATKEDLKALETKMATKTDLDTQQKTLKTQGDVLQIMLKEIKAVHEDSKSFRDNISTLYTDHVGYDRKINNLTVRVEKLEIKN